MEANTTPPPVKDRMPLAAGHKPAGARDWSYVLGFTRRAESLDVLPEDRVRRAYNPYAGDAR
jgi:hypothetical protein